MLYTFLLGIMVFIHIGTTDGDLIRGMFIMVMCILIILFTDIVGITGHIMHTNIITVIKAIRTLITTVLSTKQRNRVYQCTNRR